MKKRILDPVLALLIVLVFKPSAVAKIPEQTDMLPYKNPHLPVEQRVADLLFRMTLEEKAAQTQAIWEMKKWITDKEGVFLPDKAAELLKYGLGQVARPSENRSGGENLDPKETAVFANAIQKYVMEKTRLGIPLMFHEEGLHGQQALGATSFPQAIALASTWDPGLVLRVFSAVAREIRARGGHQALTPVLDVARDPRWGRTEETYGEDPYLVSQIGAACIRGFQGNAPTIDKEHVVATAKHFAVHGQPEGGVNVAPANYSERIVREIFLRPFKTAIVDAGALSVMPSYNEVDGIPSHANRWFLEQILRQEWGFKGIVVSDYSGIDQLRSLHHVAGSKEDAAKTALETGVDIELPDIDCYGTLLDQVKAGRISEAVLDRTVERILRIKFMLGLFEVPYVDVNQVDKIVNCAEHKNLALEAACKSVILLKNENNLLPLDIRKLKRIAVIGPNAADIHLGGYTNEPRIGISVLEGLQKYVGTRVQVEYAEGCKIVASECSWFKDEVKPSDPRSDAVLIRQAVKAVKKSDVVLLVVGGNEQTCREAWSETHLGDRASLDLAGQQNDLVNAVVKTGKPVVVLLINGRPLSINAIAENVPAVLEGWYMGQETGTAAARVLFGEVNPGGKLPISFPRSVGHLPVFYNKKPSANRGYLFTEKTPLFPFGHGLAYTTFHYDSLQVIPNDIGIQGKAMVRVNVTNTGKRTGDEVVQMYIRDQVSSVTRPVMELKGFQRITLNPGETRTVRFEITPDKLSFFNGRLEEVVEPGLFDIMVGTSSAKVDTVVLKVAER